MKPEELEQAIGKALEVWSLQTVSDLAIVLSFIVLALVVGQSYLDSIRDRLTLRVATEVWDATLNILVDVMLAFVAAVGLFIINPDIMADIKIGVPWVPVAMVLLAAALVIRAFHGGRVVGSVAWRIVLGLIVVACLCNWFGFTLVMEAAGDEYAGAGPGSTWEALQNMRSDFNHPLALTTFYWTNSAMILVLAWAVVVGASRSGRARRIQEADHGNR